MTSYLTDRWQYVCTNYHNTSQLKIHADVPQGPIVVPLRSITYINDLENV